MAKTKYLANSLLLAEASGRTEVRVSHSRQMIILNYMYSQSSPLHFYFEMDLTKMTRLALNSPCSSGKT